MESYIIKLWEKSKQVISDCLLTNGGIVAANSRKAYFPKAAKNYYYVWPRDAYFILKAAHILGTDHYEAFFDWCRKAEGWQETGLFYEKYYVSGKQALHHFQPDQTGSVLMAFYDYYHNREIPVDKLQFMTKTASVLRKSWDQEYFNKTTQDLWEERMCFPDLKENFSYSLAICARGLELANKLKPNTDWLETAMEMKQILQKRQYGHFFRSDGLLPDKRIDASLLGICWPGEVIAPNHRVMKNTIAQIEKLLVKELGLHRYEQDEYDGWMYDRQTHRKKGAGYWPLLNFWMSIYQIKAGNREKALKYFYKVLEDLDGREMIPEQIFDNELQVSVSPLCWSHAMFVLAARELGLA